MITFTCEYCGVIYNVVYTRPGYRYQLKDGTTTEELGKEKDPCASCQTKADAARIQALKQIQKGEL